ncbi:hypothetical protein GCM10028808_25830 [Spirosoma migulaei]
MVSHVLLAVGMMAATATAQVPDNHVLTVAVQTIRLNQRTLNSNAGIAMTAHLALPVSIENQTIAEVEMSVRLDHLALAGITTLGIVIPGTEVPVRMIVTRATVAGKRVGLAQDQSVSTDRQTTVLVSIKTVTQEIRTVPMNALALIGNGLIIGSVGTNALPDPLVPMRSGVALPAALAMIHPADLRIGMKKAVEHVPTVKNARDLNVQAPNDLSVVGPRAITIARTALPVLIGRVDPAIMPEKASLTNHPVSHEMADPLNQPSNG